MKTIHIEVPDDLAKRLALYKDPLIEVLESGLEMLETRVKADSGTELATEREAVLRALAGSANIRVPISLGTEETYVRCTPVQITGKPVSEIAIEQRGPR
jgi:hypothetical protein